MKYFFSMRHACVVGLALSMIGTACGTTEFKAGAAGSVPQGGSPSGKADGEGDANAKGEGGVGDPNGKGDTAGKPDGGNKPPVVDTGKPIPPDAPVIKPSPIPEPGKEPLPVGLTESFVVGQDKQKVDLVWVIDNSSSMSEEIELVQDNLNAFIATLDASTDTRTAVLSTICRDGDILSGSAKCVTLSQSQLRKVKPFSRFIDSHDSFRRVLDESGKESSLGGFYRARAKKVFVFVTDDESDTTAGEFFQGLERRGVKDFSIFAFAGLKSSDRGDGCHIENEGEIYTFAAGSSGGKVFDICLKNWSRHFAKLSESVVELVQNRFEFKTNRKGQVVDGVTVDGKVLLRSEFKVSEDMVEIEEGIIKKAGQAVVVTFRR